MLAEQKLQALFGAGGVGERVKLGKLLKADVARHRPRAKDTREPALEVVVSETGGGLRLLIRGVPITTDPDADVAALLAAAQDGIKKHAEKITEVVAVPPFVSQNLSTEHDHLKAALAQVAEQAAQARPGTLTVELEEAQALAKELATAAPGTAVTRPLPLYLLGEFRHTGTGADRTVSLKLRAERGGKPVGKGEERSVKPDEAAGVVRTWAVAVLPANGAPVAAAGREGRRGPARGSRASSPGSGAGPNPSTCSRPRSWSHPTGWRSARTRSSPSAACWPGRGTSPASGRGRSVPSSCSAAG